MRKVIDITEKLNFEENPKIKIKDVEVEVNSDATTMLKIMGSIGENVTPDKVVSMYELIIPEKDRKKIDKLHLNMTDFQTVVVTAINVVTGESEGE